MALMPRKITLEWNQLEETATDDEILADVLDVVVEAVGPMSGTTVIIKRREAAVLVSIVHTNDETLLKIMQTIEVTRSQNTWTQELRALYASMIEDQLPTHSA